MSTLVPGERLWEFGTVPSDRLDGLGGKFTTFLHPIFSHPSTEDCVLFHGHFFLQNRHFGHEFALSCGDRFNSWLYILIQ